MKRETSFIAQLYVFVWLLVLPIGTYAQGNKVSLKCSNMALTSALLEVEKQSGYYKINYNSGELSAYKVTATIQNLTPPAAVNRLLTDLPFSATSNGKFIQINRASSVKSKSHGAGRTITGHLFDSHGDPLIGASVKEVGTKNVAVTDIGGRFELQNVAEGAVLEYSYIGMKTYRRKASDKATNIILEDDSNTLNDVVVTGMQTMDKRLFTGASTKINASDAKLDGVADISRSLEGRAAGVSVQNVSGTFGTAPKIRVRGATSIFGSSKPLWVVDGVIMEDATEVDADNLSSGDAETLISNAIAGLNADDIESFQVLKDGSATSIYGAKAMAGVIVVTTKKGRSGTNRINYTGEFTLRLKPSYSQFNIMNSQEQMDVYRELEKSGYLNMSDTYRASNSGVYGKMYHLLNDIDPVTGKFALENTPEARASYLQAAEYRNTDWFDVLFNNSISQNHAVSMSSGTDRAQYYTSLSVMSDPGWTKQSKVNRYTANLNSLYNITKTLKLNLIANASYRKQRAPGTLSSNADPVSGEVKRDFDINPYSYALNTSRTLDANEFYVRNYAPFNILHELDNNYMDLKVTDLRFQGELKWKPFSKGEFSVLGAYKASNTVQQHKITDYSNQAWAFRAMDDATMRKANPWLYTDPDNPNSLPVSVLPSGGFFRETKYSMESYDVRASFSYNNVFKDKHIVNYYGGMELNAVDRERTWFNGVGMQYGYGMLGSPNYLFFKQGQEENAAYYTVDNTKTRDVSFFSTATYSYDGRYTLNGTIRYEGSNKLGRSRKARWLPTWNVSAAWNAHEEKFWQKIRPIVSNLTLKASYSLTADRGPSSVSNSLAIIQAFNAWRPFTDVSETGAQVVYDENRNLTYEKKHEFNIGLDAGFLNNRINLTVDWYKRNNYDLIGIYYGKGLGTSITNYPNVASMESHGVEVSLSTVNIKLKDFSWNTDFVFSDARNKVTNLKSNTTVISMVSGNGFALEGYPVRSLFSFDFKGLNENGYPTFINEDGELTTSNINFQEQVKKGHLVYEGPTDPPINGSLNNTFKYKNFSLNVFMTYSFGNVVRLDPVFHSSYSDLDAMPREFINRWTKAGDEKITNVPVIADRRANQQDTYLSKAYNAYNYSTERCAKGDFIRMKEISVDYQFPLKWISKWGLTNLSLKLQATNLFLIYSDSKLNGQDPEFMNTGGVATPMPRQFTLTLRLGL